MSSATRPLLLLLSVWIFTSCADATGPEAVGSVQLAVGTDSLTALGQTTTVTADVLTSKGKTLDRPITFGTSAPSVATVSATGVVTAVGNGSTTISATSEGVSGTKVVKVVQGVGSVQVTPGAPPFLAAFGAAQQMVATARDPLNNLLAEAPTFAWTSSSPSVATVNAAGLVTAVGNGTALIRVTTGTIFAEQSITVAQVVASVAVTPGAPTLNALGQTVQLTPAARDANLNPVAAAAGDAYTYSSSNTAVATVNSSGLVTAVSNGTATITATRTGAAALQASATITVAQVVTSMLVTPDQPALNALGQTVQLTATPRDANLNPVPGAAVTWSSGAASVATVNSTGLVTAVAEGSAAITATATGGVTRVNTVTVDQVVATLSLDTQGLFFDAFGSTFQLNPVARDANENVVGGVAYSYSSSDPAVATVSASGLVTSVANGSALITAATVGGVVMERGMLIDVAQAVATITPSRDLPKITRIGGALRVSAVASDAQGNIMTGIPFTFASSSPAVAEVDLGGGVTGRLPGTVVITASGGGRSGTIEVLVEPVALTVVTTPSTAGASAFGRQVLHAATVRDSGGTIIGGPVTWTSTNPAVAEVTSDGTVTAVGNGTTVINATQGSVTGGSLFTVDQVVASMAISRSRTRSTSYGEVTTHSVTLRDSANFLITGRNSFWTSSDSTIVRINETTGVATSVDEGTVTITARAGIAGAPSTSVSLTVDFRASFGGIFTGALETSTDFDDWDFEGFFDGGVLAWTAPTPLGGGGTNDVRPSVRWQNGAPATPNFLTIQSEVERFSARYAARDTSGALRVNSAFNQTGPYVGVVQACTTYPSQNPGTSRPAVIGTSECVLLSSALSDPLNNGGGNLTNAVFFPIPLISGRQTTITVTSGEFDPVIYLISPNETTRLLNEGIANTPTTTRATLTFSAPQTGTYSLLVTTKSEARNSGSFTIAVTMAASLEAEPGVSIPTASLEEEGTTSLAVQRPRTLYRGNSEAIIREMGRLFPPGTPQPRR